MSSTAARINKTQTWQFTLSA